MTEEQLKEFILTEIKKCYFLTPSAIASMSYYAGFNFPFTKTRSISEDVIKIYKTHHPLKNNDL